MSVVAAAAGSSATGNAGAAARSLGRFAAPGRVRAASGEQQRSLWYQFSQQRLKAWQPILTPAWTIPFYIAAGAFFLVMGLLLVYAASGVVEYTYDYTDEPVDNNNVGHFDLHIDEDLAPPIWIYYQLEGFYQNHRRYVKSYDPSQLSEADAPKTTKAELQTCDPATTLGGRVMYPCGLVARSLFNDSYVLLRQEDAGWVRMGIDDEAENIAWSADLNGKYRNVDPEGVDSQGRQHQEVLNMWILQRYPPVECEQIDFSDEKPYVPVSVVTRTESVAPSPDGAAATVPPSASEAQVADCAGYMTDSPVCNFTRAGEQGHFDCSGDYRKVRRKSWGIESGHLIVWMRIAGLPNFRKLWGKVDEPLSAGTKLRVYFVDNFPVKKFYGRKSVVLATSSLLGGRFDLLGVGYIVLGVCCLTFGMWKLTQCLYCPRTLGDISILTSHR